MPLNISILTDQPQQINDLKRGVLETFISQNNEECSEGDLFLSAAGFVNQVILEVLPKTCLSMTTSCHII